jgi:hypothetical protein
MSSGLGLAEKGAVRWEILVATRSGRRNRTSRAAAASALGTVARRLHRPPASHAPQSSPTSCPRAAQGADHCRLPKGWFYLPRWLSRPHARRVFDEMPAAAALGTASRQSRARCCYSWGVSLRDGFYFALLLLRPAFCSRGTVCLGLLPTTPSIQVTRMGWVKECFLWNIPCFTLCIDLLDGPSN